MSAVWIPYWRWMISENFVYWQNRQFLSDRFLLFCRNYIYKLFRTPAHNFSHLRSLMFTCEVFFGPNSRFVFFRQKSTGSEHLFWDGLSKHFGFYECRFWIFRIQIRGSNLKKTRPLFYKDAPILFNDDLRKRRIFSKYRLELWGQFCHEFRSCGVFEAKISAM